MLCILFNSIIKIWIKLWGGVLMLIRKYLSRTKVDNYNLMKICSFISSMFPFVVYIFLKYGNDRTYLIKNKFNNMLLI